MIQETTSAQGKSSDASDHNVNTTPQRSTRDTQYSKERAARKCTIIQSVQAYGEAQSRCTHDVTTFHELKTQMRRATYRVHDVKPALVVDQNDDVDERQSEV